MGSYEQAKQKKMPIFLFHYARNYDYVDTLILNFAIEYSIFAKAKKLANLF